MAKRNYSFDPKRSFEDAAGEAMRLASLGYRRVSNKHRIIARVDRPDWQDYMASTHPLGMEWVNCLGKGAPDHYRRCHSDDWLEGVPPAVFRLIPASGWDDTGYVTE